MAGLGKFTASFTRSEKQIIGFVLAILVSGFGIKTWFYGNREPIVISTQGNQHTPIPAAKAISPDGKIKINEADPQALEMLPGVGPQFAQAIVAHRDAHGPFRTSNDLDSVAGIGPSKLGKMLPLVDFSTTVPTVAPLSAAPPAAIPINALTAPPDAPMAPALPAITAPASTIKPIININIAGRSELDTLLGIGPALAARIMADRQANGPFRTVEELARVKGIGPKVIQQNRHRIRIQ